MNPRHIHIHVHAQGIQKKCTSSLRQDIHSRAALFGACNNHSRPGKTKKKLNLRLSGGLKAAVDRHAHIIHAY
jgi:hypothetical protein